MRFTIPKLFKDGPAEYDRRIVIRFALLPIKTPSPFSKSRSYIWLEKYYAHQFYSKFLGGTWITQYTSRLEEL
jgi:hypothetical protein